MIASLPALEVIVSFGVGVDPIDMEAARQHDIVVANTPQSAGRLRRRHGAGAGAVDAVRGAYSELDPLQKVRASRWRNIAHAVRPQTGRPALPASRASATSAGRSRAAPEAFGMDIAYHNRSPRARSCPRIICIARMSMRWRVKATSWCCPCRAAAIRSAGRRGRHRRVEGPWHPGQRIARQRGGPGRLGQALREGRLAGAGLDVFDSEPEVPAELCAMEQVVAVAAHRQQHRRNAAGHGRARPRPIWMAGSNAAGTDSVA